MKPSRKAQNPPFDGEEVAKNRRENKTLLSKVILVDGFGRYSRATLYNPISIANHYCPPKSRLNSQSNLIQPGWNGATVSVRGQEARGCAVRGNNAILTARSFNSPFHYRRRNKSLLFSSWPPIARRADWKR